MQTIARLGTVRLSSVAGSGVLSDAACDACEVCLAGRRTWCSDPLTEPTERLAWSLDAEANGALTALACLAAFVMANVPNDQAVLVLGSTAGTPIARLIERAHSGLVVVAEDPRDPQVTCLLAENRPSGRADAVVTHARVREAVKAVRRGGHVCVASADDTGHDMPSVTEVVQREVAIVGAGDVSGTAVAIGPRELTELFSSQGRRPIRNPQ